MLNANDNKPIKFTSETEVNNKLPFRDLRLTQNELENQIEFEIYRKSTATARFITSDSNHLYHHNRSAFHSMVYRLVDVPMKEDAYQSKITTIKTAAKINGYPEKNCERSIYER